MCRSGVSLGRYGLFLNSEKEWTTYHVCVCVHVPAYHVKYYNISFLADEGVDSVSAYTSTWEEEN